MTNDLYTSPLNSIEHRIPLTRYNTVNENMTTLLAWATASFSEPATLALMLLGLTCVAILRKRLRSR